MKYELQRSETVEISKWEDQLRHQKEALAWLTSGSAEPAEVDDYVKGILGSGRSCDRMPEALFWGFAEPEFFPSEERVLYFYTPTYNTIAFLIEAFLQRPEEMLSLAGFRETLSRGLLGATGRNFRGAGFDGETGFLSTMTCFPEVSQDFPCSK